jgi:beta-alanine degradation protein BauB
MKGPGMANEPSEQVGERLMFENDRVRVWDIDLAPGESLPEHIHRLDYVILVASGGLIRFADLDDPAGHRDVQYVDDQVSFREVSPAGKIDHQLTNIGTKRHRNFVIELKPR